MLKVDAEEKIAALMDSVSGLLCSQATRLQESTAATLCAVWVELQGGTIIVAPHAVPEKAWCSCLSGAVRAVCAHVVSVWDAGLLVQLVCAFLHDYLQDLDVCCARQCRARLERACSCQICCPGLRGGASLYCMFDGTTGWSGAHM